ncbi:hypothetical protein MKQ70_30485 [Chitinophaga sedimenti]|nr:hypothetical protein [Chitinophaga sedimenti]MCK7559072.1 hypothetical protein [Chitinophaga sedimenti]
MQKCGYARIRLQAKERAVAAAAGFTLRVFGGKTLQEGRIKYYHYLFELAIYTLRIVTCQLIFPDQAVLSCL